MAGASTAAGAAAGALAWLLTQVKTTRARTPTATTIQVVDETDFTKFLILSNIVSPFYYLSQFTTLFFSVLINIFMKSFKQFLTEMESPEASGSQQRNPVPPGSIPPPKGPPPTRLDPGSLPPGHDRPDGQGPLPPEIDWQALDDKIQDLLGLYRFLMGLIGSIPWDQFVEYMQTHYGNTNLGDRSDFDDWFRQYSQGKVAEWFRDRYPDSNYNQYVTYLERLYGIYSDELWEIFVREYFPSDVEEQEQEAPERHWSQDWHP